MPHYENLPFEVPESWTWKTLGDIGTWQAGGTPSRMHKEYYGGNIPWLKTGDLNDGIITSIPEYITEEGLNNSSAKLNPKGSVLIAMYGATIGKIGILGMPATTNQACCACINYEGVIQKYLFYFLLSHKEEFIALGGGGAQPNISKDIIVKTLIPIPPIKEQERIISQIDNLLNLLETLDTNKNALETSISQAKSKILDLAIHGKLVPQDSNDEPASELLIRINPKAVASCDNPHYADIPESWVECKLGEVCTFESGYAYSSELYRPMGIPLIRISNIVDGVVNIEDCVYIKGDELSKNVQVKQGDLLIAMSGATTGKIGIYTYTDDAILNQRVGNIKVKDNTVLSTDYRDLFVNAIKVEIEKKAYGGAQPNISGKMICDFSFSLPPYNEQKRIVSRVKELFSQLDMIEKSLQA